MKEGKKVSIVNEPSKKAFEKNQGCVFRPSDLFQQHFTSSCFTNFFYFFFAKTQTQTVGTEKLQKSCRKATHNTLYKNVDDIGKWFMSLSPPFLFHNNNKKVYISLLLNLNYDLLIKAMVYFSLPKEYTF